jgi:non-ribosomal peptide synthetase component E (peptide arylation enzyme)
MTASEPLFRHPRLIAATMIAVLALLVGGALCVRPLSGDLQAAHAQSKASLRASGISTGAQP